MAGAEKERGRAEKEDARIGRVRSYWVSKALGSHWRVLSQRHGMT